MQSFVDIQGNETLANSRQELLNNDLTVMSSNSGTSFPTTNLQVGMLCLRTDLNQLFQLKNLTPTWVMIFDLTKIFVDKGYVDTQATGKVSKTGDTMTGNLVFSASGGERRFVFDFGSSNQMWLYGRPDGAVGLNGAFGGAGKSVFEYAPSSGLFNINATSFKYNDYTVWHSGNVSPVSKTGDTMSGALFFDAYNNIKTLVSASKPFIQIGGGEWALLCGQSGSALAGNAYHDGTDWHRYDTTKPASVLYCYQDGTNNKLMLGTAPAGSGVINFTMNEVALANTLQPHGKQTFTSSGTFTVPAGITTVWVSMCGGGGGGGGRYYTTGAGGGGADSIVCVPVAVTPGQQIAVTIGGGGAGGKNTGDSNCTNGSTGGTSSFGAYISCAGGGGGPRGGNDYNTPNPPVYGGSSGGTGGTGGFGSPGMGGGSCFFGTGASYNYSGSGYGSGGGGGSGSNNTYAPAGRPGICIVEW